jgi:uroporphyrinogen decarboxylase
VAKRKAIMTERERIEAILRREKPDRIPIWSLVLGFATVYTGTSIADVYNKPEVSLAAQRKAAQDFGWVFDPRLLYASMGGWEFGGDIKWPSGEYAGAPTCTRFPVKTEEDVWKLEVPDVATAGIVPIATEFYKLSTQERLDNEPFNAEVMVGGPFTRAGTVCGHDNLIRWVVKKPEVVHHLVQVVSDFLIELMKYWKDMFGVEGVLPFTGHSVESNALISPKHFEKFCLPINKAHFQKILDMGYKTIFCHICGEQNLNLPYWAQIPLGDPGIASIGDEIDILKAAEFLPQHVILGNVNTTILQTGTPDDVYEDCRVRIEKGKQCPGGFILAPACELPPMAPAENVMAMTEAINDLGWY